MKKTINKIIAFSLSFALLITGVIPAFSIQAASAAPAEKLPEIVEYSNSGKPAPERIPTGTDLDNFSISLRYGGIDNNLGDSLNIKDATPQISVTAVIEYKGNQEYPAQSLSFTMDNLLLRLTRGSKTSSGYHTVAGKVDVGADYILPSGETGNTGRGDWYYQSHWSDGTAALYFDDTLTFVNKNPIKTGFTSTIEMLYRPDDIRSLVAGTSMEMNSVFKVAGIDSSITSNSLFLDFTSTHDDMAIGRINVSPHSYLGVSPDDYVYNGYSYKDYWMMRGHVSVDTHKLNRGFDSEYDPATYSKLTAMFPSDCIVFPDKGAEYEDPNVKNKIFKNHSSPLNNSIEFNVLIPKAKYNEGDTIPVQASFDAVFYDLHESVHDEKALNLVVKPLDFRQYTVFSKFNKSTTSYGCILGIECQSPEGAKVPWDLQGDDNLYGHYTDIVRVIEDYKLTEIRGGEETSLPLDKYYLKSLWIEGLRTKADIYGKKTETSEYELLETVTADGSVSNYYTFPSNEYHFFKIESPDLLKVHPAHQYHEDILPDSIKNYAVASASSNGKEIYRKGASASYGFSDLAYKPTSSISFGKYQYANNVISWNSTARIGGLFGQYYNGRYENVYVNPAILGNNQFLDAIEGQISSPLDFGFDFKNFIFSLQGAVIHNDSTNEDISLNTGIPVKELPDYLHLNFDKKVVGDKNQTHVKVTLDPGYRFKITKNDFEAEFGFDVLMNDDVYSYLKQSGKLMSSYTFTSESLTSPAEPEKVIMITSSPRESLIKMPTFAASTFEGVDKLAESENASYTKDILTLKNEKEYTYKLRVSGGQTKLNNIVLYDNLEQDFGNNEHWNGVFNGIDTTFFNIAGITDYTIYYSDNPSQQFDLSAPGWVKEADWTRSLADVKSIAVSLGATEVPAGSLAFVEVKMLVPSSAKIGAMAYNSYAADYDAYDAATGQHMETVKALKSNTAQVMYAPDVNITIVKEWLTPEKAQPVTVHLLADGTEIKNATLSADNNWTITYDNLPALKNGKKVTYSVKEDALKDIEVKYLDPVIKDNNITFKITNEYVVRYKDVTVKKDWVIPSDNLQVAISDDNGYTTDFYKVEFYNHDESQLLETVNSYSYSNVVSTKNKYSLDSSYVAYVYYNKTDAPIKVVINETPVKLVPINVNITTPEGVQTVTLSKDNNWTQTVQVRADGDFTVEEVTTGNWTSNIVPGDLTVITNTIENNNKVVLVKVPVSDVPVTGNVNYSGFFVAVMTLGFIGLATVSCTKKKKHR